MQIIVGKNVLVRVSCGPHEPELLIYVLDARAYMNTDARSSGVGGLRCIFLGSTIILHASKRL
jgi:hypothetical protein